MGYTEFDPVWPSKKTPSAIVDELAAELRDIAKDPTMIERLKALGVRRISVTCDDLRKMIATDYDK